MTDSRSLSKPRSNRFFSINRLANPKFFFQFTTKLQPWINGFALFFIVIGIIWGLFISPADWQQGDSVRIMYIHVPMAMLASAGYILLAFCGFSSLVWKHPLADLAAKEIGPVGAIVTALCLITGSIWGKPMWGTWWVWDARLTSVLILFFLYLGHITLCHAFDEPQKGYKAASILALAGVFDLPIIKFSVQWWNTLHQPNTFSLTHASSITLSIATPLIFCSLGFSFGFIGILFTRIRTAILENQIHRLLINSQSLSMQ